MHISAFDYELPSELIAQQPLTERDASRLLVIDRADQSWSDSQFSLLSHHLNEEHVLVLNNTRVFPARLIGQRIPSGGRIEVLLVRDQGDLVWEALVRPGHRVRRGDRITFDSKLECVVTEVLEQGARLLRFEAMAPLNHVLEQIGQMPLPPYIKRPDGSTIEDKLRYQTVYARTSGAIAAPTAGLHFTTAVLDELKRKAIDIVEITLHVGYGTFEPVRVDEISYHQVAAEAFEISRETAALLTKAKAAGKKIVSVGTTTTRALESAVNEQGEIAAHAGYASLTITPGYKFRAVDGLITNFHLPKSSLLLLVAAFAGRELILNAYRHAVQQRYRFYSYGDCMLIL